MTFRFDLGGICKSMVTEGYYIMANVCKSHMGFMVKRDTWNLTFISSVKST